MAILTAVLWESANKPTGILRQLGEIRGKFPLIFHFTTLVLDRNRLLGCVEYSITALFFIPIIVFLPSSFHRIEILPVHQSCPAFGESDSCFSLVVLLT
ncbi:MAG: hypothetical protein BWX63_02126 [Bacteroidetes bacterium ADurb.Bin041]|nr:MAG: hypothetical protein BWX63_02126 [Bacteroidetes bacterium ADurb.Bin041]